MAARDNLNGQQFMRTEDVGRLKAGNPGASTVDDWASKFRQRLTEPGSEAARAGYARFDADIAANGVEHELTVEHEGNDVRLKEGHHRYAAAKLAGQREVPVRHQAKDSNGYITAWPN
jgi:ParB-like nuclease family protein